MQRAKRVSLNSLIILSLAAFGCGSTETSTVDGEENIASVESQLNAENGNYSMGLEEAYAFDNSYLKNLDLNELDWSELDALPSFDINTDLASSQQPANSDGEQDGKQKKPCTSVDANGDTSTEADGNCDPNLPAACPSGHLWGKYKKLKEGLGLLRAVVVNKRGEKIGFLKGIYGRGIFFAKAINLEGKPMGIVAGKYADGEVEGSFMGHAGVKGRLRGNYEAGRVKARWKMDCPDGDELPPVDPNQMPDKCFAEVLGDDTSCKPFDVWTEYAKEVCHGEDYRIVGLSIAEPCDKGSFRRMKVECCRELNTDKPEHDGHDCKSDHEANSTDGKDPNCTCPNEDKGDDNKGDDNKGADSEG
jgi:hypothetical protein